MTAAQTEQPHGGSVGDPRRRLGSAATRSVLIVQQEILRAAREFLAGAGFVELQAPITGPATDPGVRGAAQVEIDYYGRPYKLMTSAILYKQTALLAFDRIFSVVPNVRLEPVEAAATGRHLAEFHQIDVEVADASREEVMRLLQDLVVFVVGRVVAAAGAEFETLGRDPAAFEPLLREPFGEITHAEALRRLGEMGVAQDAGEELGWIGEEALSREASGPFFVTDYPRGSRGFYDRESATEPGILRNFDLIAPEGFGELSSGAEREYAHDTIVERMRETGEDPADYGWYMELARDGLPPSAGFGVGLERLTRYIVGCASVVEATAFPRIPGVVSP